MNISILKQIESNLNSFSFLAKSVIPIIKDKGKESSELVNRIQNLISSYLFILNLNSEKEAIIQSNLVAAKYTSYFDFADVSNPISNLSMCLENNLFVFKKVPTTTTFYQLEDTPNQPPKLPSLLKITDNMMEWKTVEELQGFEYRFINLATATSTTTALDGQVILSGEDLENKFYLINIDSDQDMIYDVKVTEPIEDHARFGFFVYDGEVGIPPEGKGISLSSGKTFLPHIEGEERFAHLALYRSFIFRAIPNHLVVESICIQES